MSTNAVSLTSNKASNKGDEDDEDDRNREYYHNHMKCNISSSSISEIEEEEEAEEDEEGSSSLVPNEIKELFGVKQYNLSMPSIKEEHDQYSTTSSGEHQAIYVGVGKSESSMEALMWALKHAAVTAASSTMLYLIHVFPEINYIPSPLGKLPKSQVSSQQVETYMAQERGKRRELLHTFLDKCSAAKVKVDTVLIESDMVGRAMLDLIPILNIKRLVLGTTKSNIRKLMSRKGNGITDQILQRAPEGCEINIICEGNQVMLDRTIASPSPPSIHHEATNSIPLQDQQQQRNEGFSCICFKAKYSDI